MSKEIFIVGGGPSLQGFSFDKLRDKETIAVNKAVLEVPNPTYFLTADSGIAFNVVELTKGIDTIKVLAYSATHKRIGLLRSSFANFHLVIRYKGKNPIERKTIGMPDIGFNFDEFQPGQNSGFCALQFAVIMGYSPIYLLGFDLTSNENGKLHRHYDKSQRWQSTLDEFFGFFKRGLIALEGSDVKVFSCSSISRLNGIIPFLDIDKVLS